MTKGEIDRLGQKIAASSEVLQEDLNKLQEFRQTFQEPISNVNWTPKVGHNQQEYEV